MAIPVITHATSLRVIVILYFDILFQQSIQQRHNHFAIAYMQKKF
jgi:hypothetical protein